MTSALFTDGINHGLAELEIPNEFILFSFIWRLRGSAHAPCHPGFFFFSDAEWPTNFHR